MTDSGTRVLFDERDRPVVRRLRVDVRSGPDKGATFELDCEPIRIGSSEGCDVRLSDSSVSGVHAEINRTPLGLLIRDLSSTNGTLIDGRRIEGVYANDAVNLRLGESEIRVTVLDSESSLDLSKDDRFGEMVGASIPMRALFARLHKVVESDTTVLITGETGTGKELVADAIRSHGPRAEAPFVVVDCGAMPANLIESELFGHERGAFTGAGQTRHGAFERAHGGTIFLDEIGEMPLNLQPALLGILERREARRVGGSEPIPVDVRVITATNRDLADEVKRGAFRADLYYRLAVVEVRLPPLRERVSDIPILIDHFLDEIAGEKPTIGTDALEQLKQYPWPGNIRELRNVIARAALLSETPTPRAPSFADPQAGEADLQSCAVNIDAPFKEQKNALVATFEENYVRELITATKGNVAAAARKAGIDRMYLYKLLERYHIDKHAGG